MGELAMGVEVAIGGGCCKRKNGLGVPSISGSKEIETRPGSSELGPRTSKDHAEASESLWGGVKGVLDILTGV